MQIANTPYPLSVQRLQTASGLEIAYTDRGKGFPLLFLHGLGSYLPAWQKNLSFLSEHFRCLALDLPGFGKSSKEGFIPRMRYYAEVTGEFLDKLEIGECCLAGHSMGGQLALYTALHYPQRIKKLALLAPAGLEAFTPEEARQLQAWFIPEKLLQAPLATVEKNVKANFYCFPEDARPLLQDRLNYTYCSDYPRFCEVLSHCVAAMLQEPVLEMLHQLQMPVQILFGRQDGYIPSPLLHPHRSLEEMIKLATAGIAKAELHFIDQCGHFVQWEQAAQVNKLLADFLCYRLSE